VVVLKKPHPVMIIRPGGGKQDADRLICLEDIVNCLHVCTQVASLSSVFFCLFFGKMCVHIH
jgi:hypothetical protein